MPSKPTTTPASTTFADDFFGDRFVLAELSLPRQASGYAVQMLNTDTLLDQQSGQFYSVRSPQLQGLFSTFDAAHAAASRWLSSQPQPAEDHQIAIVPAAFDDALQRHILIYGVLRGQP